MALGVVTALKARLLAVGFIKNNPRVKAVLDHPAGPFTSECCQRVFRFLLTLTFVKMYDPSKLQGM